MNEGSFWPSFNYNIDIDRIWDTYCHKFFLEYLPRSDTEIKVHRQCGGGLYKNVLLLHSLPKINIASCNKIKMQRF